MTSTQRSILGLAILALAVGAYFLFAPPDVGEDLGRTDQGHVPLVDEAIAATVELEGEQREPETRQRETDASQSIGRRVLVLAANGQPLAGVAVRYSVPSGERAARIVAGWQEKEHLPRPWQLGGGFPDVITDSDGLVDLPTRGAGAAGVVLPDQVGAVVFPALTDGEISELLTLQLRAIKSLEVLVRDESGQPIEGKLVELAITSAARLAELNGAARRADSGNGGPWETTQIDGITDVEGRTFLPLSFDAESIGELDLSASLVALCSAAVVAGPPATVEVPLPHPGLVELTVPATGSMRIKLLGYPSGVTPMVYRLVEGEGYEHDLGLPNAQGWHHFSELPIGKEFQVAMMLGTTLHESGLRYSGYTSTGFPVRELAGPTAPGQTVEYVLNFERPPGLYGRLEVPEHRKKHVGPRDIHLRGIPREAAMSSESLVMTLFADGEFFARTREPYRDQVVLGLPDFSAVSFEFLPTRYSPDMPAGESLRRPMYAERAISVPTADAVVDLGTITLSEDPPLLHVRVTDAEGEPVSGANLHLTCLTDWHRENEAEPPTRLRTWGSLVTDRQGEFWLIDRDWYSEFGMLSPDHPAATQGEIRELQVSVSHKDYRAKTVSIPISQSELDVQLEVGCTVHGSIMPFDIANSAWVVLVPPGEAVGPWKVDRAHQQSIGLLGRNGPDKPVEFTLSSVPAGTWDVCFALHTRLKDELVRVPSVQVIAGEACRDPRLQGIDLSPFLDVFELELVDENGARLTPPALRGNLVRKLAGGFFSSIITEWREGRVMLAEKKGSSPDGELIALDWIAIELNDLKPGVNQRVAYRCRPSPLSIPALDGVPAGTEWNLELQSAGYKLMTILAKRNVSGTLEAVFDRAGSYQLSWRAERASDGTVATATSTVSIELAQILRGDPIAIEPPSDWLATILAW